MNKYEPSRCKTLGLQYKQMVLVEYGKKKNRHDKGVNVQVLILNHFFPLFLFDFWSPTVGARTSYYCKGADVSCTGFSGGILPLYHASFVLVVCKYQTFAYYEIMLAITAKYNDWSRSLHQPISIRDSTGQGLHDANIISPMADLAKQLYATSRSSYLYVLEEEGSDSGKESLLLKELAYVFGAPLGALGLLASIYNFTKMDVTLSKSFISMWSNFIKLGHPKDTVSTAKMSESVNDITSQEQIWPKYHPVYQKYFQIGTQNIVRNHYRAGKVALWSWLLPGLERVGSRYGPDKNFHRLPTDLQLGLYPESSDPYNLTEGFPSSPVTPNITGTTDILHNLTIVAKANKIQVSESANLDMGKDFPYMTALTLTVAIACSLLILNILVLTTVYYRHKANRQSLAKVSQDANSEDGNDVQLHSSGDNCKTIYAPGHYGTLRPSIIMHSNLATAFEEESQHDWTPDYISSVQRIDDMSGVTSNRISPDTQGTITNTQMLHEPKGNILSVTTLKQPVASYTSPNDVQLVSTYSNKENQLVQNYSPNIQNCNAVTPLSSLVSVSPVTYEGNLRDSGLVEGPLKDSCLVEGLPMERWIVEVPPRESCLMEEAPRKAATKRDLQNKAALERDLKEN
ncbi:neuroligin-4, X-linked-like [Palaemon carinicauda]|uniref:neuroligin-4, X-linked-like n=1 Tax=Palaemon carinicauda TaxID=392227 RepID=UPI0035B6A789